METYLRLFHALACTLMKSNAKHKSVAFYLTFFAFLLQFTAVTPLFNRTHAHNKSVSSYLFTSRCSLNESNLFIIRIL